MESQPQNPEFMINPENFHPCQKYSHEMTPQARSSIWETVYFLVMYQYIICNLVVLRISPCHRSNTLVLCTAFQITKILNLSIDVIH